MSGFSVALQSSGHGCESTDMKFVLSPQGALRFKIEHSETPFPAFLRQDWSSLKFSLKSKILNENRL